MKTTLTPSEQHMVTLVVIIAECLFKAESLSDRPHSTAEEYVDKVFELTYNNNHRAGATLLTKTK